MFAKKDPDVGEDIKNYTCKVRTATWEKVLRDMADGKRRLKLLVEYLDPGVEEILVWKTGYLRECRKIKQYACKCMELVLPHINDEDPSSFQDYIASL